jgi:hypothetical protein
MVLKIGASGGSKIGGGRNIFSIGKSGAQKLNPGELVIIHHTLSCLPSLLLHIMIDD